MKCPNCNAEFVSIKQFAEARHVSLSTVRAWIRKQQLPAQQDGRQWWINAEQVELFTPPKMGRPRRQIWNKE